MPFVKGQSGNPGGRKKNEARERLEQALKKEGETRGIDFLQHIAQQAFEDSGIAKEVLKKLIPDLKAIEAQIQSQELPPIIVLHHQGAPDSLTPGSCEPQTKTNSSG